MKMSVECGTQPPMSIQCTLMAKKPISSDFSGPTWIGVYITVLLRCWPCTAA